MEKEKPVVNTNSEEKTVKVVVKPVTTVIKKIITNKKLSSIRSRLNSSSLQHLEKALQTARQVARYEPRLTRSQSRRLLQRRSCLSLVHLSAEAADDPPTSVSPQLDAVSGEDEVAEDAEEEEAEDVDYVPGCPVKSEPTEADGVEDGSLSASVCSSSLEQWSDAGDETLEDEPGMDGAVPSPGMSADAPATRTRSQLSLVHQQLTALEQQLVPVATSADLYYPMRDDTVYQDFLQSSDHHGQQQPQQHDDESDADDHDYVYEEDCDLTDDEGTQFGEHFTVSCSEHQALLNDFVYGTARPGGLCVSARDLRPSPPPAPLSPPPPVTAPVFNDEQLRRLRYQLTAHVQLLISHFLQSVERYWAQQMAKVTACLLQEVRGRAQEAAAVSATGYSILHTSNLAPALELLASVHARDLDQLLVRDESDDVVKRKRIFGRFSIFMYDAVLDWPAVFPLPLLLPVGVPNLQRQFATTYFTDSLDQLAAMGIEQFRHYPQQQHANSSTLVPPPPRYGPVPLLSLRVCELVSQHLLPLPPRRIRRRAEVVRTQPSMAGSPLARYFRDGLAPPVSVSEDELRGVEPDGAQRRILPEPWNTMASLGGPAFFHLVSGRVDVRVMLPSERKQAAEKVKEVVQQLKKKEPNPKRFRTEDDGDDVDGVNSGRRTRARLERDPSGTSLSVDGDVDDGSQTVTAETYIKTDSEEVFVEPTNILPCSMAKALAKTMLMESMKRVTVPSSHRPGGWPRRTTRPLTPANVPPTERSPRRSSIVVRPVLVRRRAAFLSGSAPSPLVQPPPAPPPAPVQPAPDVPAVRAPSLRRIRPRRILVGNPPVAPDVHNTVDLNTISLIGLRWVEGRLVTCVSPAGSPRPSVDPSDAAMCVSAAADGQRRSAAGIVPQPEQGSDVPLGSLPASPEQAAVSSDDGGSSSEHDPATALPSIPGDIDSALSSSSVFKVPFSPSKLLRRFFHPPVNAGTSATSNHDVLAYPVTLNTASVDEDVGERLPHNVAAGDDLSVPMRPAAILMTPRRPSPDLVLGFPSPSTVSMSAMPSALDQLLLASADSLLVTPQASRSPGPLLDTPLVCRSPPPAPVTPPSPGDAFSSRAPSPPLLTTEQSLAGVLDALLAGRSGVTAASNTVHPSQAVSTSVHPTPAAATAVHSNPAITSIAVSPTPAVTSTTVHLIPAITSTTCAFTPASADAAPALPIPVKRTRAPPAGSSPSAPPVAAARRSAVKSESSATPASAGATDVDSAVAKSSTQNLQDIKSPSGATAAGGGGCRSVRVPRRTRHQLREAELNRAVLAPEPDQLRDQREAALASGFFQRLEECVDPAVYSRVQQLLLTFNGGDSSASCADQELALYDALCQQLSGCPEQLQEELLAFFSPSVAVQRGRALSHIQMTQVFRLAQRAEIAAAAHPSLIQRVQRSLTALSGRSDPPVTAAELRVAVLPLVRGCSQLLAELQQLLPAEPPPEQLTDDPADFQSIRAEDLMVSDNVDCESAQPTEAGDGEQLQPFEELTELPAPVEPDRYGTPECRCDCHLAADAEPRLRSRSRHCHNCGLKFIAGRVFLQTGKVLRPARVISFAEGSSEPLPGVSSASTGTSGGQGDHQPLPAAATGCTVKRAVRAARVQRVWTQHEDIMLMDTVRRRGDGDAAFRSLQQRLSGRSVAQLKGRFNVLMETLKKKLAEGDSFSPVEED